MKIKIYNLSRGYQINKNETFYALKDVTLMFNGTGFTSIVGKSGSGKSTLLNLIAGLDKQTSGDLIIGDKNIKQMSPNKRAYFYKKYIGVLFQQYNLLEDETVLFNVMLPLLINGWKEKKARDKAKQVLEQMNIDPIMFDKKASFLSGGEKQRVALARTIINEPEILLCDEPTGALDSNNSKQVMEILKEYSKSHIVIMVSHNLQIVKEYSDRIIEIASGSIKSDKTLKKTHSNVQSIKKKIKTSSSWVDKMAFSTFKKHLKRNLLTSISLIVSLSFSFLAIGYINGKDEAINNASKRQFDFGVGRISKEEKLNDGSLLSLSRVTRPDIWDLQGNSFITENYEFAINFDAILPQNPNISYDGTILEGISFIPIYSFDNKHVNVSLLDENSRLPQTINEVIINNSAYEILIDVLKKDPMHESLTISNHVSTSYVDFDETNVVDELDFTMEFTIVGVVEELNYLQTPKIYYSYIDFYDYFSEILLENLTTYFNEEITWTKRIEECEHFDILSSYSYILFPKDINSPSILDISNRLSEKLSFSSTSFMVRDSLISFMDVAKYGILLFLAITLSGTVLIFGILSFTSYSEDRKKSAILTCLGARMSEIVDVYLEESFLAGFISLLISFAASYFLSFLVNRIINGLIDIDNLIVLPIRSFFNIPFLFPIAAVLITIVLCALCTCLPIYFSKKISLKEELQSL